MHPVFLHRPPWRCAPHSLRRKLSLLGAVAGPDINDYGIEQDKGLASLRLEAYRFRPDEPITLGEFSKWW